MAMSGGRTYSQNYQELEEDAKKCYNIKLDSVSEKLNDPYTLSTKMITPQALPDVQYPDIYNYLISTPSVYTKEDIRAIKAWKHTNTYWLAG